MPYEYKNFNNYSIFYNTKEGQVTPNIFVNNDNENIGNIYFLDKLPISKNSISNQGKITIRYHIDRFNDIINILRYEKPLKIYIDTESLNGGIRTASAESIGEQEPQEI